MQMAVGAAVSGRNVLRITMGPARHGQLADSQLPRLDRVCDHRALSGRHPPGARASGRAPFFRYFRRKNRPRNRSRSWSSRPACSRRSESARSSPSSARWACATTSRAGLRSTPCSHTTFAEHLQRTSPLHDGAAIVQNDRVPPAHVFSADDQSSFEQGVGSRHRAAIGLTEETTRSRSSCPRSRARCRWWSTGRSSAARTDELRARLRLLVCIARRPGAPRIGAVHMTNRICRFVISG